jgi:hypothetical protein
MKMQKTLAAALMLAASPAMSRPALDWTWMERTSCAQLLKMNNPPLASIVDADGARYMFELYKSSCSGAPPNTCVIAFVAGGHIGTCNRKST